MQNNKNFSSDDLTIGIIGAGIMGRGIAQVAATAGVNVILHDMNETATNEALAFVSKMLDRAVAKGRLQEEAARLARTRIQPSARLDDLAAVDLVIEAVIERLDIKQALFVELEKRVADDCILATNTSSLSVTAVAAVCNLPGRVAGLHFFNPVPLMKLVEVISAVRTDNHVAQQLSALVRRFGHTPVMVADSPGFLVNHVGRGLLTEGLRILFEGITEPHVVDAVMRDCVGLRMGPFELMDLTGLDVTFPASEQVYRQYFQEPRVRPTPLQQRRYVAGLLGHKTGQGWYRYADGDKLMPAESAPPDIKPASPLWLSRASETDFHEKLSSLLKEAGGKIDTGEKPGEDSIAIVMPLGGDVTTAALAEGLEPQRTVGIDPLFATDKRLVLMSNPATRIALRNEVWSVLANSGRRVSVINDSSGFIAQRIVATIINIACDIAQQRIARPKDIDTGARLGLAYPDGPLARGDQIGPHRVLGILENLYAQTGDPRYRPSPWLRRRAQLKLSLLTEESAND